MIPGGGSPAWAPSGGRIAFVDSNGKLSIANADGTGASSLGITAGSLDWGPMPDAAYARPKAATPVYAPFVPAYQPCDSPNRQHAAPLDFGSCAPPVQTSAHLTLGTPPQDPVNSVGSLRARVIPGDLEFTASVTDVRNQGSLGRLHRRVGGATAAAHHGQGEPAGVGRPDTSATVADTSLSFAVPCTTTADTTIGSTCSVNTSANVLIPGSVVNGTRAIWALDQVQLYDGGDDALASTTGDNTLFMVQGVFVP